MHISSFEKWGTYVSENEEALLEEFSKNDVTERL